MNLKNRIEKLEMYGGSTETSVQFVGTFNWLPPTDTMEDWLKACKLIDLKYAEQKRLEAAAQSGR